MNLPGLVKITWVANTESDLKGYRLYASAGPISTIAGMTPIADEGVLGSGITAFTDTFTWSPAPGTVSAAYYKLVAVDFTLNVSLPNATTVQGQPGPPGEIIQADPTVPVIEVRITIVTPDGKTDTKSLQPGGITGNARPTFGGKVALPPGTTVTAGSTFIQVEIKVKGQGGGTTSITQRVPVAPDGSWNFQPPADLPDGGYFVTLALVVNGKVGQASDPLVFTVEARPGGAGENPFRLGAGKVLEFGLALPEAARVTAKLYTQQGELVVTLAENQDFARGYYGGEPEKRQGPGLVWRGTNEVGATIAAGIYLYQIEAVTPDGRTLIRAVRKIVVIR